VFEKKYFGRLLCKLGHNVRQDGVENFKGIATRSNYDVNFKDVNPAFDFKLLEKILKDDK